MKRPKDNEADSFGIPVTMRGKQLHTSLGVAGNTLHSGNVHTHAHKHHISSHCHHWQQKRDSPCADVKSAHLPPPHCPAHSQKERWKAKVNTRVTYDFYRIHEKVTLCVSGRLVGSVRPPVFTHKQPNLQPDRLVWVWSPVSHSPGATLAQGAGSERAGDTSQPFTLYSLEKKL